MKAKLVINEDMYTLEIHSESDIEAIALDAWSNIYFKDVSFLDDSNHKASLLIVRTVVDKNA